MKLSYQWLKQWVNVDLAPEVVAEQLTLAGIEIEECLLVADQFSGVVVAEVKKVEKHPEADKLSICEVSIGDGKTHKVVCGAQNVTVGVRVPYAQVGAILRQQTPEPKKIVAATLRNVNSAGMLCSAADLGMAEISAGLLLLPLDAPLGQDVREYLELDDILLDVQVTPNRGDCLSVLGVAREIGAINHLPVKKIPTHTISTHPLPNLPIHLDAHHACLRYASRCITEINNKATTPVWMQELLRRAGMRCISPVVDVMNYVMLEIGQPLHAFDFNTLEKEIHVRFANLGEKLILLDGQEISLEPNVLIIADAKKPQALAGIMGGLESSVTPDTHTIFIESAHFVPSAIQGRARQYGLQTDASYRFERGVDPLLPLVALDRATELLLNICGGKPSSAVDVEARQGIWQPVTINLSHDQLNNLLGTTLAHKEVSGILHRLQMQVEETPTGWQVQPPSFRFDMQIAEDVVEEIARIYGYTHLPATLSRLLMSLPRPVNHLTAEHFAEVLVGRGYQEVITYSFIDPRLQTLCEPDHPALPLTNPIASDLAVMRTSIWPGLLNTLVHNANRQQERIRCFEQGLCFVHLAGNLQQPPRIAGIISGTLLPEQWQKPVQMADFYALKGDVMALLGLTQRAADFTFIPAAHSALHPGQSAAIIYQTIQTIGHLGAFHPRILQTLGIKNPVYGFELQLTAEVTEFLVPRYQPLSRFPTVRRDLAIIVKENILAQQIEGIIREISGNWLQNLVIFDTYSGKPIPAGSKSLALGLTLQASDRTLTDGEVDSLIKQVLDALAQEFNAELRE